MGELNSGPPYTNPSSDREEDSCALAIGSRGRPQNTHAAKIENIIAGNGFIRLRFDKEQKEKKGIFV